MVQAFVISRLDYCNALCYGITDELTRCLQSAQNAAGRLVTGIRRRDHSILPVLRQLHWLPVRQRVRVVFKIATLVHQSLSGLACLSKSGQSKSGMPFQMPIDQESSSRFFDRPCSVASVNKIGWR